MEFNCQKYEHFFPRKVYWCACLAEVIQKSLYNGNHSLVDILDNINNFKFYDECGKLLAGKVFSVKRGDNNKDCIFLCEKHLAIVLLAKMQFVCTQTENSETATVNYDVGKKERYCKGCIEHYFKLMFNYFYFVNFE